MLVVVVEDEDSDWLAERVEVAGCHHRGAAAAGGGAGGVAAAAGEHETGRTAAGCI